jgi:putative membrane protein
VRHFLARLAITMAAIWVATRFVTGLHYAGGIGTLIGVALVFSVVNAVLKPILKILTCPLILLTLGLFTLVVNALLLLATARLARALGLAFTVDGFVPAFWGGLIIGVASFILTVIVRPQAEDDA